MKKSWRKSKTFFWGHIQLIAGATATALGFLTPALFPEMPIWVYGLASMFAAVITYVLRSVSKDAVGRTP